MWLTIKSRRALYVDYGRDAILCDRFHSGPVTFVMDVEEIDGMPTEAEDTSKLWVAVVGRLVAEEVVRPVSWRKRHKRSGPPVLR